MSQPSPQFEYYSDRSYWNNYDVVNEHINRLISGCATSDWRKVALDRYGAGKYAFVPNCGNGWVERDLAAIGLIGKAYCTDISEQLLEEAQSSASTSGLDFTYEQQDVNSLRLPAKSFDCIVNHAAFHHITYLDHAMRTMAASLKDDGVIISLDYVGPHRNQYGWRAWSAILELNKSLPEQYQAHLTYPHQPTMIHMDPSEAVHSELIFEVFDRYFERDLCTDLGGAIAYTLLYDHKKLFSDRNTPLGDAIIRQIVQADEDYTRLHPEDSLFAFWSGRRKKDTFLRPSELSTWTAQEEEREQNAKQASGRYGAPNALEIIYNEMSELKDELTRIKVATT